MLIKLTNNNNYNISIMNTNYQYEYQYVYRRHNPDGNIKFNTNNINCKVKK